MAEEEGLLLGIEGTIDTIPAMVASATGYSTDRQGQGHGVKMLSISSTRTRASKRSEQIFNNI